MQITGNINTLRRKTRGSRLNQEEVPRLEAAEEVLLPAPGVPVTLGVVLDTLIGEGGEEMIPEKGGVTGGEGEEKIPERNKVTGEEER